MNRNAKARARQLLACALLLSNTCAWTAPTPGSAAWPRSPHLVTPDAPVQPDYVALALSNTSLTDDPAWRPLHLRAAGRPGDPAIIVLPVQTQAYGFSPKFRALLGARLDQELQRRHLDASRQTDIVDWRGPFVRRSDDATLAAFGAAHAGAVLLALTLGHDADGHALVSLSRTDAGKTRIAHQRVDIPQDLVPMLDAFTAALPPLLGELGMGDRTPAPPLPAGTPAGCQKQDWALADLPPTATPRTTACHALLMGTLMPDFMASLVRYPEPNMPDRLAWLARAWVESTALAARAPAFKSAARLAAFQLGLDRSDKSVADLVADRDVVVQPLARVASASERSKTNPQVSRAASVDADARKAARGLPPLAATLVLEQARFGQAFHTVDLCAIEQAVPQLKATSGCATAPRPRPVSQAETQLLEEWRLAAVWADLYNEGHMRGDARSLAAVESAIPSSMATHPLLREMRFLVNDTERPVIGASAQLEQARSRLQDYAQAVATLQRNDFVTVVSSEDKLPSSIPELTDPRIARTLDDLRRLTDLLNVDFFGELDFRPAIDPKRPVAWLAKGNYGEAMQSIALPVALPPRGAIAAIRAASGAPMPRAPASAGVDLDRYPERLPGKDALDKQVAADPYDMNARVALALIALEHGASVAEARRVIDARPTRKRVDDAIGETTALAAPGYALFFAGELAAARPYFERAAKIGVGSNDDLMSRIRVAQIDGNVHRAFEVDRQMAERYTDEWATSNQAGYLFMAGHANEAWALNLPPLQTTRQMVLWRTALAGHRAAGTPLGAQAEWLGRNQLQDVIMGSGRIAPRWLNYSATLDRLPLPPDAATLRGTSPIDSPASWTRGMPILRAAIEDHPLPPPLNAQHEMDVTLDAYNRLLPFYALVTWSATKGADPSLQRIREAPLEAGFEPVLAKAAVLAADGKRDEALRFLTAARYELGRTGTSHPFRDDFRTAPYEFVLTAWLMTRKTGEPAYAQQGLAIATAYQRVTEYMAWPYAAEALLGHDPKARETAACRAARLDPGSMFLHESGLHPNPEGAACRKATAW